MTSLEIRHLFASALALLLSMLSSGCGNTYDHAQLGLDSPQAREISLKIDALRETGPAGIQSAIARDGASGLTEHQKAGLQAVLRSIAIAESAKLVSLDRFGGKVFRSGVEMVRGGQSSTLYLLLVVEKDRIVWAGPN